MLTPIEKALAARPRPTLPSLTAKHIMLEGHRARRRRRVGAEARVARRPHAAASLRDRGQLGERRRWDPRRCGVRQDRGSTLRRNVATAAGGARRAGPRSHAELRDTIIAENGGGFLGGGAVVEGATLIADNATFDGNRRDTSRPSVRTRRPPAVRCGSTAAAAASPSWSATSFVTLRRHAAVPSPPLAPTSPRRLRLRRE